MTTNTQRDLISDFIKRMLGDNINKDRILFLTIRYGYQYKTIDSLRERFRKIMGAVLKEFQGKHWYKNPSKCVSIIEHGKMGVLHTHTLLNIKDKPLERFIEAVDRVCGKKEHIYKCNLCFNVVERVEDIKKCIFNPHKNHLLIEEVCEGLNNVINYILKEYDLHNEKTLDFSNFFNQDMLFNPDKEVKGITN